MDGNDAKQEIARSHKNPASTKRMKSASVHGWIACQESGFRRIPQVGKCFPYGGTSRCRAFHDASRRDCGTRPEVANTIFLVVLCRYPWFCTVELPHHEVETAAEPPQELATPPTVVNTDEYGEPPSFTRLSYRLTSLFYRHIRRRHPSNNSIPSPSSSPSPSPSPSSPPPFPFSFSPTPFSLPFSFPSSFHPSPFSLPLSPSPTRHKKVEVGTLALAVGAGVGICGWRGYRVCDWSSPLPP